MDIFGNDFDIEVGHDDKYIINKINSNGSEIKSDFHDDGLTPEITPCVTYSIILIDSVYINDKSYYPQKLLDECKYKIKVQEIKRLKN